MRNLFNQKAGQTLQRALTNRKGEEEDSPVNSALLSDNVAHSPLCSKHRA